ncbi:hypothetical protein DFJ63DRAFT_336597 [Scheffersomyces coipomensis]|uniref:uncharacterized protein n=1 Tax=Scheffersomyces coipomensis TaxID=1788519 RepID=UPI00315D94F6
MLHRLTVLISILSVLIIVNIGMATPIPADVRFKALSLSQLKSTLYTIPTVSLNEGIDELEVLQKEADFDEEKRISFNKMIINRINQNIIADRVPSGEPMR